MPHITWQHRHQAALLFPNDTEFPIVYAFRTMDTLSRRFSTDYVLRAGVAELITGWRQLLLADWGQRLEMGLLDGLLIGYAARIGFCLDHEEFDDDCQH